MVWSFLGSVVVLEMVLEIDFLVLTVLIVLTALIALIALIAAAAAAAVSCVATILSLVLQDFLSLLPGARGKHQRNELCQAEVPWQKS